MQSKILVVDDDRHFNRMLTSFLEKNGYLVHSALTSKSAIEYLLTNSPDLVLTDFKLPDLNGLELMKLIRTESPEQTMILMTHYSDIRTAVKSIQLGAFEFVTKPIIPDELLITIKAALKLKNEKVRIESLGTKSTGNNNEEKYIIGKSKASSKVWEQIHLVAPTKMSVMIMGESGTGKEYAARLIYNYSTRKNKPFVAVDCGALSKELAASELFGHIKGAFTGALKDKKGQFELSNGGTIFLDEVGNLSYEVQIQLLRVLQEQKIRKIGSESDIPVDVRVISATNEQLKYAIDKNNFRLDLFHRLNEFEIFLAPLKERIEDLDEYLHFFLAEANSDLGKNVKGFHDEVIRVFSTYHWPGNFRELRNIVRRAVLMTTQEIVGLDQIPGGLKNDPNDESFDDSTVSVQRNNVKTDESADLKKLQEQQEKETIERVLLETKYNKSKAATLLNINRTTLYNKILKYNIEA
jgi:two-component system, NtrC family, response regulator HydG